MNKAPAPPTAVRVIGRYAIYSEIASGGMATVHLGRLLGEAGFSRTVAIKRLHPQFAKDPDFVAMFLDEARLASRIRHPNVVSTLDVVALDGELFLVMEYVQGESLSRLVRTARNKGGRVPPKIALSVMTGVLQGLHAAHEAKSESGELLGIVHRDVSPQNVLIDADGAARVIDFGVAKAAGRLQATRDGVLKGKLQYMAPEQIEGGKVDRRSDVYAASVVLWEVLAGRRLFQAEDDGALLNQIFNQVVKGNVEPPSKYAPTLPKALDAIVLKGVSCNPDDRFATARDMAIALEKAAMLATPREVGEWVEKTVGDSLRQKAEKIAEIESVSAVSVISQMRESIADDLISARLKGGTGAEPTTLVSDAGRTLVDGVDTRSDVSAARPDGTPMAVSGPPVSPPITRRGAIVLVTVFGVIVLGALGLAASLVLFKPAQPTGGNLGTTPPAGSTVATVASSAPPAASSGSVPTLSLSELPLEQEADAGAGPAAKHAAPGPLPQGGGPKTAPGPKATTEPTKPKPPPPSSNCDPPFTIDPSGIKRYKPQCL